MARITVRQAILADAAPISALYNATITGWARRLPDGSLVPAAPDELTLFERWLIGGPWTSVEMCAVHLANLLRAGDGIPIVAELDGQIAAEAELFIWREAEPFGHHVNISKLTVHPDSPQEALARVLLDYIYNIAVAVRARRVTMADAERNAALLERHHFARAHTGQRHLIAAQAGRVFYQAAELKSFDPAQIANWHMPLGRLQSARQEWDRLAPDLWNSVPEIVEVDSARLHLTVTGQEAIALMQQDRDIPDRVHAFVWTRRPINSLLLMALRDWAAQRDYREIAAFVWDYVLPQLEVDTVRDAYTQVLYSRAL